ncbi:MAG: hypothetical protein C5B52_11240 [Bacteroidetes bacterium]|nr:MAG: hypothetical protein C5B52_11240 [Bacteroidota bacterium]
MLRNYLKTAWRNLVKNKFYSLINISGLAIGLAVGLLILLWAQDEFSFDSFHKNQANIYKLENMVGTGTSRQLWPVTAAPIGIMGKKKIPGIKEAVRVSYNYYYGLFKYKEKLFNEDKNYFVDPSFFSVFDFNLVKGNSANPFPDKSSIVITESIAKKYFGNEEPIGKVIVAEDTVNLKVTGVIHDLPKNTNLQGDIFYPISLLAQKRYAESGGKENMETDFSQFNYDTYLLLEPGFNFQNLAKSLRDIHLSVKPDDTDIGYVWLPLSKIHLYRADGSDGGIKTVRMFIIIAVFILFIACINYINLSTARSLLRAKEVSLRKIVGAAKTQLFIQFIAETTLLFVFATGLALVILYSLLPAFNNISGKEIELNINNSQLWKVIGVTIASSLVVSSIYPAILLSSFEPIKALKGKITARFSSVLFRQVLVVVQFCISVILIVGTLVVGNQLKYIQSKELGYDKENVLSFPVIRMYHHLDAVRDDLLNQPGITGVTWSNANIISYGNQTGDNSWDGKENGETLMLNPMNIHKDFIPFFKMQLVEGKNFEGTGSDSTHFILNESAVRAARLKNPIGKRFKLWQTEGTIIGVVKDFHFSSLRNKINPAIFYSQKSNIQQVYVKVSGKQLPQAIDAIKSNWEKYNAGFPFEYNFLDEKFKHLYLSEQRTSKLFDIFAGIAIFISCLGLLGLAAYMAQVRTREIGVRKVLGANVIGIIQLLAKDFIKLVFIAIIIATPIAWYIMNKWLQDFAYKISIGWSVFVIAGILAIIIAMISISVQSIKAAIANPVKSLRTE